MKYDAREISILVRDGLLLLQERENGRPPTLIEELEKEATTGMERVESVVDGMSRQERLWLAHGMNDAIANPDTPIPGTFSRTRWAAIKEMFDAFKVWVRTPLPVCGFSPITIMSWRGNPPDPAPEPPAEQAQPDAPPPDIVIVGEVEDVLMDGKKTKRGGK